MHEQNQAVGHNLFRNETRPEIYCAVPEDRTIPPFIRQPGWEFVGKVVDEASAPAGFKEKAACSAANHLGFYVFHRIH